MLSRQFDSCWNLILMTRNTCKLSQWCSWDHKECCTSREYYVLRNYTSSQARTAQTALTMQTLCLIKLIDLVDLQTLHKRPIYPCMTTGWVIASKVTGNGST